MIELDKYIELLLLDHDCVILPDFGGFVVHNEAAYIDEEGMFYPPYRSLGFNMRLTVNDGLLVQSIMQTYDTDYPKALRMLEGAIKSIKKELRQNGEWEIGSLGTLMLNENGNYVFEPLHEAGISTPQFYGLDVLDLQQFVVAEELPEVEVYNQDTQEEEPLSVENEYDEPSKITEFTKAFMKYAAVLIGAFVLFFATSIPVNNVKTANLDLVNSLMYAFPLQQAVEHTISSMKGVTPVNDLSKAEEKKEAKIEQIEVQDTIKAENTVKEGSDVLPVLPKKGQYTIILASQVIKSNADHFINQLNEVGFKDAKYMDLGCANYVVYSSFDSMNSAYHKLNELKHASHVFDEAWVLQIP